MTDRTQEFERRLEALVDELRGDVDDADLVDALRAEVDRVQRAGENNALAEFAASGDQ